MAFPVVTPASIKGPLRLASTMPRPPGVIGTSPMICAAAYASSTNEALGYRLLPGSDPPAQAREHHAETDPRDHEGECSLDQGPRRAVCASHYGRRRPRTVG